MSLRTLYRLRLPTLVYIYSIFSPNRLTKTNSKLPLLPKEVNELSLSIVVNKEEK